MKQFFFDRQKMKQFLRNKEEDKYSLENTELLLEEHSNTYYDSKSNSSPISIFSEIELNKATSSFHSDLRLHSHYPGSDFYKGIHQGRAVLIYKLRIVRYLGPRSKSEVISEIVALSQINHKNVVKLLGCCLETFYPIQVYEFCFDTLLHDKIHKKPGLLSWEDRLRIAAEIADAVTYLHTVNSGPIVHRDISSKNVFLDENCVAKLFDLSDSVWIPPGKTHQATDLILKTHTYLAPEQSDDRRVSVKTDVFSFGILLLELLTGYSPSSAQDKILIKGYVDLELDILADCVKIWEVEEEVDDKIEVLRKEQLEAVSALALKCTRTLEKERPTMIEVANVLHQIKRMQVKPGRSRTVKRQEVDEEVRPSKKQRAYSKCRQAGHNKHTCKGENVVSSKGGRNGGTKGEQMGGQKRGSRGKPHGEGTARNTDGEGSSKNTYGPKPASVNTRAQSTAHTPPAANTRSARATAAATSSIRKANNRSGFV